MKRTIGIIFVFIIFVAGAMLFTGCGRKTVEQTQPTETTAPATTTPVAEESHAGKAWIQVTKPGVFIIANDNTTTTLSSGDELNEGATIMTDATGLANVVFVDGSVARLDSNTRVTVLSGSYDKGTKTLSARFKLTAGNLWSKIIALATPESYWEVQTSNAIAAVRGTAFGVSYDKETTRIIGSEHTVTVKAVNPKTNEIITDQETTVGEGKYIVITVADIEPLIKKTAKLADWVRVTPKKILDEVWIKRSIEADLKIVNQIKTAESMGLTADQSVQIYLDGLNDEKQAAQAASAAAAAPAASEASEPLPLPEPQPTGSRAHLSATCDGSSTTSKGPRVPERCWNSVRDSKECKAWPPSWSKVVVSLQASEPSQGREEGGGEEEAEEGEEEEEERGELFSRPVSRSPEKEATMATAGLAEAFPPPLLPLPPPLSSSSDGPRTKFLPQRRVKCAAPGNLAGLGARSR